MADASGSQPQSTQPVCSLTSVWNSSNTNLHSTAIRRSSCSSIALRPSVSSSCHGRRPSRRRPHTETSKFGYPPFSQRQACGQQCRPGTWSLSASASDSAPGYPHGQPGDSTRTTCQATWRHSARSIGWRWQREQRCSLEVWELRSAGRPWQQPNFGRIPVFSLVICLSVWHWRFQDTWYP